MKRWGLLFLFLIQGLFLSANDTVVGVHGFMLARWTMIPVEKALRCTGLDVCLWNYPSRKYFIQEHACHLNEQLCWIAAHKPGQPIHFIAHSIGGLIVRAALNLPNCPQEARIGKIVLLAPPNKGSELARYFRNAGFVQTLIGAKSGWQLVNYTENEIDNCLGCFPDSVEVLVLAGIKGTHLFFEGPNDGFIALQETYLNTPHTHCILQMNHSQLLSCPGSLHIIRNFLLGSPCSCCYQPVAIGG